MQNVPTIKTQIKFAILILVLLLGACGKNDDKPLFLEIQKLVNQGNPEAQYHLGMMYNNGIGTDKDPNKAYEWFTKAESSGDPLGAYKLGCYYAGQFAGVWEEDAEKSLQYKLIAAKAGYSRAQHDVGNAYYKLENHDEAINWWRLAAQQGDPGSIYNLSLVYREGKVTQENKILAYAYFKLANLNTVQKVNKKAQENLDEYASTMTSKELEEADELVSTYKAEPTVLTQKAYAGLEEARKLISN